MAAGYLIALVLETAGLVGLVFGLVRLRAERRARAAELRGLLLTGNANAAAGSGIRSNVPGQMPLRVLVSPGQTTTSPDGSAARAALDRALESLRQTERSAA